MMFTGDSEQEGKKLIYVKDVTIIKYEIHK
jgi:hypothetical protein